MKRPAHIPDLARVAWVPKKPHTNDAEDAIFLASSYGLTPDPWQARIVQAWLGRRRDGKWCAGRCGLAVPRQNGKNAAIEIRELYGMVVLGEKFLHTAHEVKTARKAFKRLLTFFDKDLGAPPELAAMVTEIRRTNGQEAIFLNNGGSVEIVARSKGSGRGYTVDVLILDEAQALVDDELEAIRSAVSSAPLGNPQVIYAGTPPNREKGQSGEVWLRIRSGANKDPRLAWIEYGAEDGPLPDIDDMDLLFAANPALELQHANGAFGLQMDVVKDEREELSLEGYARERLGWWGDPKTNGRGAIDVTMWAGHLVPDPGSPARTLVVAHVAPDLETGSIGVAAAGPDGRTLLLSYEAPGTEWMVTRIKNLRQSTHVIEIALTPTAQVLSADLTEDEIEHELLTNTDVGRGCGWLLTTMKSATKKVAHVGQAALDAAIVNARTRYVGTLQHWDQRDPRFGIGSLVATSTAGARWVAANAEPEKAPPSPESVSANDDAGSSSADYVDWNSVEF